MLIARFLKLSREELVEFFSTIDWDTCIDKNADLVYRFSDRIKGDVRSRAAGIYKKGQAPFNVSAKNYGYNVVRISIFVSNYQCLCCYIDYNYVKAQIRRIIDFSKERPVWINNLNEIDWSFWSEENLL